MKLGADEARPSLFPAVKNAAQWRIDFAIQTIASPSRSFLEAQVTRTVLLCLSFGGMAWRLE